MRIPTGFAALASTVALLGAGAAAAAPMLEIRQAVGTAKAKRPETTQFLHGVGDELFAKTFVADVSGQRDGFSALGANKFNDLGRVRFFLREVANGNVGANAVVTKNVEPGTAVAGVPARPLPVKV